MKRYRRYGLRPIYFAVIHGGFGAPGDIAPAAKFLASDYGVIEPFKSG